MTYTVYTWLVKHYYRRVTQLFNARDLADRAVYMQTVICRSAGLTSVCTTSL